MKTIVEYLINGHVKKQTKINVKCQYYEYDECGSDWLNYVLIHDTVNYGGFRLSDYGWSNEIKCLSFEGSEFIYIYFYPEIHLNIIEVAAVYSKTKDVPTEEDFNNAERLMIDANSKVSKYAKKIYEYINKIYKEG